MKTKILRLLNLKHSESRHVSDLLTVQFFMGVANAFITILAFTLFIHTFSVDEIPKAYLAVAGALLILNLAYEKLEHIFSPLELLKIIIASSAIILFFLWLGMMNSEHHYLIYLLVVFSFLMYMITGYAFWGLVSLLYNIRESKRVFSIVGSGDIPAKLVGYSVAYLAIPIIGTSNLIWLAIISLGIGFVLFDSVIRKKRWEHIKHKGHETHHHEVLNLKKKDFVAFFFKNELIFAISLLSLISYNVFNLIDYTFLSQVKTKFENLSSLSTFITVFFALGRVIALIMKLVFTSRVIEKLGIIYTLFITPLALLAFCLIFFLVNDSSLYTVYIFGIMAMLTEVLRSTMQEPVFFILFQPLKEQLRLKGHLISKGYMLPPSLFIVGSFLILLNYYGVKIGITMTVNILLVNLFLWALIIVFLRKSYLRTLRNSIQKGFFNLEGAQIYDQSTINILLEKIKNGRDTDIIYALRLLEGAGYENLNWLLIEHLANPSKEVRKFALNRLEEKNEINIKHLREMLPVENDTEIKQHIVGLLCKMDPGFLELASDTMDHETFEIKKVLITHMLNQREFKYLFQAGNALNHFIHSTNPRERALAIEITTELKNVRFTDAIEWLIHDPEPGVKRSAIIAACKLKTRKLLPFIIKQLNNPAEKYLALQGLQHYGDELFLHQKDLPEEVLQQNATNLIKLAGRTKGNHSTHFLLSKIADETSPTEDIVHALWLKDYEPESSKDVQELNSLLDYFLNTGNQKVNDFNEVPTFKQNELVKNSIENEIKNDLVSSLKICAILYNKQEFNRILELLEHNEKGKLFNAVEMLELVLPKKVAKDLNNLFDFLLDPLLSKKEYVKSEISIFFNKIVHTEEASFSPWTKAVCIYCSWKNNQVEFIKQLKKDAGHKEHYIVEETKQFVLQSIES